MRDTGRDGDDGHHNNDTGGYRGAALRALNDAGAAVGDSVVITYKDGTRRAGILMPRYEHDDGAHVVTKLSSGYNAGIDVDLIREIAVDRRGAVTDIGRGGSDGDDSGAGSDGTAAEPSGPARSRAAEKILLLSTGGTIASRIDYRTGAVTPVLSASDLRDSIPELADIAEIDSEVVMSEYSENIMPEHWLTLARRIDERAGDAGGDGGKSGTAAATAASAGGDRPYAGIIVAHGTDTMHYTSAFLSFALAGLTVPIVLVGAQRSSDRASSDAATNLIGAARFITSYSGGGGVYIAMHDGTGDDAIACHVGTRVRKNHTSKRDAFATIGGRPAFVVSADGGISPSSQDGAGRPRPGPEYSPKISLDRRVALVKYYPGYDPAHLGHIIDSGCRAVIFEGTGLGHVGRAMYGQVARAGERGVFMGMTSQCIDGRTAMTVYESGRDLMEMGVVPLEDMIPEVALVKAMWAASRAGDSEGIRRIMLENVASEMTAR
ncbi:MAG: Glu-tRNA(Gln) amidotransferase subunit GatD [Nitrosopumilaceae archaeon]|nr:Glu-tRNA(Gln) amidotransferase subunit GatD [Nitrosopumilaceae archaeon]